MTESFKDRVRKRLREEKTGQGYSDRTLADKIRWSPSKVTQKLTGRTDITLEDLEALCLGLGLSPTEVVRDRGLEFAAELTPTELRVLETLRKVDKPTFDAFLQLLRVQTVEQRGRRQHAK